MADRCVHGFKNRDLCKLCEFEAGVERAFRRASVPRFVVPYDGPLCIRCGPGDCKGHVDVFRAKPPNPRGDA